MFESPEMKQRVQEIISPEKREELYAQGVAAMKALFGVTENLLKELGEHTRDPELAQFCSMLEQLRFMAQAKLGFDFLKDDAPESEVKDEWPEEVTDERA